DVSRWLQTGAAHELKRSLARLSSGLASSRNLVLETESRTVSILGAFVLSKGSPTQRSWRAMLSRIGGKLREPLRLDRLLVDAAAAWTDMSSRLAEAIAARLAVINDPDIRDGEAVVRGTRIPVHLLDDLTRQGAAKEELLADYPSLSEATLRLALLYA